MSALHLTARRQMGRTHVCTGITVSRQQVYHPFSPSLSRSLPFILSHYHTESSHVFLQRFFLHLSITFTLFAFSLSFTIITNFPHNLSAYFFLFSFFSLVWSIFHRKKITIKKDFVVAASKRNEMLPLPSMHKFVLFINWCFFLYWTLYRFYTESLRKFR